MTPRKVAVMRLFKAWSGIHLLRCLPFDHPVKPKAPAHEWRDKPLTKEAASRATGLLGIVPATIYTVVIDVDAKKDEFGEKIPNTADATPIIELLKNHGIHDWLITSTRGHGYHIYVGYDGPSIANIVNWKVDGQEGDVRHDGGYVIIWDMEGVVSLAESPLKPEPAEQVQRVMDILRESSGKQSKQSDLLPPPGPTPTTRPSKAKAKPPTDGDIWAPGTRNHTLNRLVFAAVRRGNDIEPIIEQARSAGLGEEEIANTVASAVSAGQRENLTDEEKTITKDHPGLVKALFNLDWSYRLNIRSRRVILSFQGQRYPVDTRRWNWLRTQVENNFQFKKLTSQGVAYEPARFPEGMFQQYSDTIAQDNEHDDFVEWLAQLPEWDGIHRLEGLLSFLYNSPDDDKLAAWAGRYIFLAACQRAAWPGDKIDEIPVLWGPQGIGKSTICTAIFPDHSRHYWGSDDIKLDDIDGKRLLLQMLGPVVIELPEMQGVTNANNKDLVKAWITRGTDAGIPPYGRDRIEMKRRFIIVGTANDKRTLPYDPSGQRRFVPVHLPGYRDELGVPRASMPVEKYFEEEVNARPRRDVLWAEAVALLKEGHRANLPADLKIPAADAADASTYKQDWVEAAEDLDKSETYTNKDMAEALGMKRVSRLAREELERLGWRQERVHAGRIWRWQEPML